MLVCPQEETSFLCLLSRHSEVSCAFGSLCNSTAEIGRVPTEECRGYEEYVKPGEGIRGQHNDEGIVERDDEGQ